MITHAIKDFVASQYDPSTVIGEFSGRDSVAAILKAFEDDTINYILPIASFAGTEYGDFDVLYENYEKLLDIVASRYGEKKKLYPLLEYSNKDIWALMNGRQLALHADKYGFMTPCIGCHLYFHLTKLPFALALSGKIISGERESHDGRIKVNQLDKSLDAYQHVIKSCGGDLLMPIRRLESGDAIEKLIGWDWEEGKDHPKCVLSGNYRDDKGKAIVNDALEAFIEELLIPMGITIGQHIVKGKDDMNTLKGKVL